MKMIIKTMALFIILLLVTACVKLDNSDVTMSFANLINGTLIINSPALPEQVIINNTDEIKIKSGSPVSIEAIGSIGYDFSSWNGIDSENKKVFFSVTEDMTIGADFFKTNYVIKTDIPVNGTISVSPEIQAGKAYPANTVFTITAEPDDGYTLDSVYYAVQGSRWVQYIESMTDESSVSLISDMRIGASFIESEALENFSVIQDVIYAKPGIKKLKYDVYIPEGAEDLPLFVIIHGGGWSSNDENIMRGMAREIVKTGRFVVASIDYRWLGHLDGDPVPNTIKDLIADVYGAIAHLAEHAGDYGADSGRIAITGDSAGGHLAASAATMIERIGDGGFGEKPGVFEIMPTYLPSNFTADDFKKKLLDSVKVVAPSYGVFDRAVLDDFITDIPGEAVHAVCPIENIPQAENRSIPHYLVRGTKDALIKDADVQSYADVLTAAGQIVEYIHVTGADHAFYDWKPDAGTRETFKSHGIPNIQKMLRFCEKYL